MGLPRHPRPFCYMSPSSLRDAALFALNWFRLLLVTCGSNATSSTWRPGRHLGRWMPRRWHTRAPQFLPPQRSAVAPAGGREAAPAGAHLTELAVGSLHACATTRGGAPRYNPGAGAAVGVNGTRSPAAGAALLAPGSHVERLAAPRPTEVAPGLEGRLVLGLSRPGQSAAGLPRAPGAVAEASARCAGPGHLSPGPSPREGAAQPPPRARPVQPPGVPPEGAALGLRALPAPCPGSPWASE